MLGYALGDGSLHEINGRPRLTFAGEPEGLRNLAHDLHDLGVRTGLRRWDTKDMVEVHVHAQSFARYLEHLGMPRSPKVERAYRVPGWIRRAPTGIKAEFLAGLFGADGWLADSKSGPAIGLTQAKSASLQGALLRFLSDVERALREVTGSRWRIARERSYVVEGGEERVTWRVYTGRRRAVRRFLSRVGFAYARKKAGRARRALHRLRGG